MRAKVEAAGLPDWWVAMLMTASAPALRKTALVGVEIFAGKAELSGACSRLVGPMESFEIENSPRENILNSDGVLYLMELLLRIRTKGLTWLGTPCKSWVCLSRSFTRRSLLQPAGPPRDYTTDKQCQYLMEHNCIADVCAMVIRTVAALNINFVVGSCLRTIPSVMP